MKPIAYLRAINADHALDAARAYPDSAFVAGGTELLNWLKEGIAQTQLLIDINDLELATIDERYDGLYIGALSRMSALAASPLVRARYPVLTQALEAGASPQLRNMATIGGNLLQRTRCPYFRETSFPCAKRSPGAGCSARDGEHRHHAIFDTRQPCIAVHPSDLAVALVALDAEVHISGPAGARVVPAESFFAAAEDPPVRETVIEAGELVVGVEVPLTFSAVPSRYLKVRRRASYEFALVSVAVAVVLESDVVETARVVLGGVAHRPWRARSAEHALIGGRLDPTRIARAAAAAVVGAEPLPGTAYKVELAERAVARVLNELVDG